MVGLILFCQVCWAAGIDTDMDGGWLFVHDVCSELAIAHHLSVFSLIRSKARKPRKDGKSGFICCCLVPTVDRNQPGTGAGYDLRRVNRRNISIILKRTRNRKMTPRPLRACKMQPQPAELSCRCHHRRDRPGMSAYLHHCCTICVAQVETPRLTVDHMSGNTLPGRAGKPVSPGTHSPLPFL